MRYLIAIVCLILLGPNFACASESDGLLGDQLRAADRYLKVFDLRKSMTEVFESNLKNLSPDDQKSGKKIMERMNWDGLESDLRVLLVKNFTAAELNALSDFYSSDVGRSAMKKLPQMSADLDSVFTVRVTEASRR